MNKLALALSLLALGGCAMYSPQVMQATPTNVIVKHGSSTSHFAEALGTANDECQKYNRSAVMNGQTCTGAMCVSQFRCE